MIETNSRRWATLVTVISVLIVGEAITFLLAALLHLGIQFPLGFAEPQIIPATIVEGLCGIFLAVSAYAVFARKTWAWPAAIAAHIFAVAGVLLGITSLALGFGPSTEANTIYHRVILAVLVVVLALLNTSNVKVRMLLEEHGWSFAPQSRGYASSSTRSGKPGVVPHSTRLTRGILRITPLTRKQSGSVMSTAMPHLSSGYSATTEKA